MTADCGITSVDEVAAARAAGLDVVVTDHHAPRSDGRRPDAPIVHPALGGYPCPDLCAAGVAHKLGAALLAAAGRDPARADDDLDLVALATVADCVPLRGENRRLVRAGLPRWPARGARACAPCCGSRRPTRASSTPRTIGFRLAPRLNAAGRLARADAALELLLTGDDGARGGDRRRARPAQRRAAARRAADPLGRRGPGRRAGAGPRGRGRGSLPAYVLWGEDWHPGVIGIVASRIAERHHRPALLIALDGDQGTGSGRSIPAFDLLGGLDACAGHLLRHGGHRAAAGCTVARAELDALAPPSRPTRRACSPRRTSCPSSASTPSSPATSSGSSWPRSSAAWRRSARPTPTSRCSSRPPAWPTRGRWGRASTCASRSRPAPPAPAGRLQPHVAARGARRRPRRRRGLERNAWQGTVEPRLVLRCATAPDPGPITVLGAAARRAARGATAAARGARVAAPPAGGRPCRSRTAAAAASRACWAALVASGEPVLVVCADAALRARHLGRRVGGFALCSYDALAADPALARAHRHLVALDPPSCAAHADLLAADLGPAVHLAWGPPEVAFALRVAERDHDLRAPLMALYRALRDAPGPTAPGGPRRARPAPSARDAPARGADRAGPRRGRPGAPARCRCRRPSAPTSTAPRRSAPPPRGWPRPAAVSRRLRRAARPRRPRRRRRSPASERADAPDVRSGVPPASERGARTTPADAARRAGYPGG